MAEADISYEEYQCHYTKSCPSFPLKTKVGSQLPLTLTLGHSQECDPYFRPLLSFKPWTGYSYTKTLGNGRTRHTKNSTFLV